MWHPVTGASRWEGRCHVTPADTPDTVAVRGCQSMRSLYRGVFREGAEHEVEQGGVEV